MKKVLIFGYGNPGRQDDALGVLLADKMELWAKEQGIVSLTFDSNYQLNIEDALTISAYDLVIFADASIEPIETFILTKVQPSQKTEFTMHAMSPDFVLHLCQSLYDKHPATYLLHIKGKEFELKEELTKTGEENLDLAYKFLVNALSKASFPKVILEQSLQVSKSEGIVN
jgi:hydrogenase maturation protease